MSGSAAPRLYGLVATAAPLAAVFRRGPSRWSQVGRWDLARGCYEPGAWLSGRIFPRRSDLSPDGRLLCYFAHDPGARWEHGDTYVAVSKLPWLTALHAFGTDGTWTRGYAFAGPEDRGEEEASALRLPAPAPYRRLRPIPVVQFANERRRGWEESPDSPPRGANDIWDERRNARLFRRQPRGRAALHVESLGRSGGEFGAEQAVDGMSVLYSLERYGEIEIREDLQWADWDAEGRLLVATRDGRIQIRRLERSREEVVFEEDLARLAPDPVPAPDWARRW